MDALASLSSIVVRQKKEWGEILSGLEHRNKYVVSDPAGGDVLLAGEAGGSTLERVFLKNLRAFQIDVFSPDGRRALEMRRPFRWYFHRLEIRSPSERILGTVQREFAWFRRLYHVTDSEGRTVYQLFGPVRHPWTFEIRQGDRVVGRIVKKWVGVGKETFTDADTFGVTFPADCTPALKAVLLGAVFLIDFVHFENSQ